MAFTPRLTKPSTTSPYYSTYDRFYWMDISPYGGNCTGYAYGRTNEIAQRNLYNEFYITQGRGDGKDWIYNTWQQYTHTSGTIDIHLGDILVWNGTAGHVEVVEEINGNTLTISYSVWASTYGASQEFAIRYITIPTWGSAMGVWVDNDGNTHNYSNPFLGYIHNPYADTSTTTDDDIEILVDCIMNKKKKKMRIVIE